MNRNTYARSITRLVDRAENYYSTFKPFRIVHRPESVLAAKADLLEISKQLSSNEPLNAKGVDHLKVLLTDGSQSPLFFRDPEAAKKAAAEIRKELTTV